MKKSEAEQVAKQVEAEGMGDPSLRRWQGGSYDVVVKDNVSGGTYVVTDQDDLRDRIEVAKLYRK